MADEFINLTPENVADEHICCIIRAEKSHPGIEAKRAWLAERLKEGHVFRKLDAKECDCVWSGMTILDSMKEAGYVLSTPYYDNTQVIMVKEGSDIKSSADLAGKVVAVQLGTSGEALLSEGGDLADLAATFGDLMTCDSFLKCFTELGGAAVDAVIVDKPVAVSYAAENAGFTVLDEGLGAEQYGIDFRADDAELCKTIEGAVAQLVENGTYAEIAAKYPDIQNNLTLLG